MNGRRVWIRVLSQGFYVCEISIGPELENLNNTRCLIFFTFKTSKEEFKRKKLVDFELKQKLERRMC